MADFSSEDVIDSTASAIYNRVLAFNFHTSSFMKKPFSALLAICLLLAACQSGKTKPDIEITPTPPWTYTDLRLLGSDAGTLPSLNPVALYTRQIGGDVQVRLDLLDSSTTTDYDLYLALDTHPGGTAILPIEAEAKIRWDILLKLPASGDLQAVGEKGLPVSNLKLRVLRDPFLDTVEISMDREALGVSGAGFSLEVFTTAKGSVQLAGRLGPARSDAFPPAPVRVLLAFWDTFPALTPAQALRRWNGAHTGPQGGRHGLKSLLSAAGSTGSPVALLDLKQSNSLAALDYIDVLGQVRELANNDLLILPEVVTSAYPGAGSLLNPSAWALDQSINDSRHSSIDFNIRPSHLLYVPNFPIQALELEGWHPPSNYPVLFTAGKAESAGVAGEIFRCAHFGNSLVIPIDARMQIKAERAEDQQASENGPSLAVRHSLLSAVQSGVNGVAGDLCSGPILLLGGDLKQSTWGNQKPARNTMLYLAQHPWIHLVNEADLLSAATQDDFTPPTLPAVKDFISNTPRGNSNPGMLTSQQIEKLLLQALQKAPEDNLKEAAWQAYQSLLLPASTENEALQALRATYLGQIGHLLAAMDWAARPPEQACGIIPIIRNTLNNNNGYAQVSCIVQLDTDWDGQPEDLLVSADFFGVFERQGGYLAAAFNRDSGGAHQLIGPTWQLTNGMSDASIWNASIGLAGDPGQVRGAFSDIPAGGILPDWQTYGETTENGKLIYTSPDSNLQKIFWLEGNTLNAAYSTQGRLRVQVPLVIDPWLRYALDWGNRYYSEKITAGWAWGVTGGQRVEITTIPATELTAQAFNDSRAVLKQPEDPNYEYPPGHFLPFPLAMVEVKGEGSFTVRLKVTSSSAPQ